MTLNNKVMGQDMILLQGHALTLTFKGRNPNVARHTSPQYGDHFCKIVSKSYIK